MTDVDYFFFAGYIMCTAAFYFYMTFNKLLENVSSKDAVVIDLYLKSIHHNQNIAMKFLFIGVILLAIQVFYHHT